MRGEVDIPDAKLKISLLFQKNNDSALSASHTINISFKPQAGSIAIHDTANVGRHGVGQGFDEMAYVDTLLRDFELSLPAIWGRPITHSASREYFDSPSRLECSLGMRPTHRRPMIGQKWWLQALRTEMGQMIISSFRRSAFGNSVTGGAGW